MDIKDKELTTDFKYIPQYEGLYSIDKKGTVFSHKRGRILAPYLNHGGYLLVGLYKEGKRNRLSVHRLVALTHIPNPDNLPEIDHIDANRQNNSVDNLRWCTRQGNCNNPIYLKKRADSMKGENNRLYGKHLSEEVRLKMSAARMGRVVSKETREKIGNANRGHVMTEEQRRKLSESHKGIFLGKKNPRARSVIQYSKNMEFIKEWECVSDAARELGIWQSSICSNIKGRNKTAGGFIWRY